MKVCTKCHELRPLETYRKNNGKAHAGTVCHVCEAARHRSNYAADPDKERKRTATWAITNPKLLQTVRQKAFLKRRYGVTVEQYNALLIKQKGLCACCYKDLALTVRRPHLDHDHITGAIRGILCRGCNMGIGQLGDNIKGVMNALEYLSNQPQGLHIAV